jgi:hypothetical protein
VDETGLRYFMLWGEEVDGTVSEFVVGMGGR